MRDPSFFLKFGKRKRISQNFATTSLVLFVQMILVNIKSVFCHLHNTKSLFTFYKRLDSDFPSQTKEKNLKCATFGINKPVIEEFGNSKIVNRVMILFGDEKPVTSM